MDRMSRIDKGKYRELILFLSYLSCPSCLKSILGMRNFAKIFLVFTLSAVLTACQRNVFQSPTVAPTTLRDVPALKLNFRFEPDVPAPSAATAAANQNQAAEERIQSVQNDFDQNRPQEVLDKTVVSPDRRRVLAVYHKTDDLQAEFRLDMYSADGRLLRKITPNGMAVHFPDTIVWSPDSNNVAFVGMIRVGNQTASSAAPTESPAAAEPSPQPTTADENANVDANANADANAEATPTPAATAAPEPPASVLTFRTEQIYLANADGGDLKPITQNEGLIYFYFAWAPDSSALVTLAADAGRSAFRDFYAVGPAAIGRKKRAHPSAGRQRDKGSSGLVARFGESRRRL
jgi:hypothetical protein